MCLGPTHLLQQPRPLIGYQRGHPLADFKIVVLLDKLSKPIKLQRAQIIEVGIICIYRSHLQTLSV